METTADFSRTNVRKQGTLGRKRGVFCRKARSFSSASRGGGSETRRRMNQNANIHCNTRHHSRLCRIARASPQTGRGAVPLFSDQTTTYCTMTCAEKNAHSVLSLSAFLLRPKGIRPAQAGTRQSVRPTPIINQTIAHDGQRTEEKLQKAVSGRARGVGERILPDRGNIDIQKTSEKFCDPQIYP